MLTTAALPHPVNAASPVRRHGRHRDDAIITNVDIYGPAGERVPPRPLPAGHHATITNADIRGLSPTRPAGITAACALHALDDSMNYGEERWNVPGMIAGMVYHLTYTDRVEGFRYISLRCATRRETDHYFRQAR